jgi:predicted transcriptional regulator of viral defense system
MQRRTVEACRRFTEGDPAAGDPWGNFIYFVTIIPPEAMTVTKQVRLGPRETALLFGLESQGRSVFTLRDACRILDQPPRPVADVLYQLRRKRRVVEVRKGRYLLVPARAGVEGEWSESIHAVLGSILDAPYYVGFWSAMNYWGFSEQVPRVVHVIVPARKRGFEFHGQRVQFVVMKRDRIFGVVSEPVGSTSFLVSDPERTILDGLLRPRYCGGIPGVARALADARSTLDWGKMGRYARQLSVEAVDRRLGYLLEVLDVRVPLRSRLGRPFRGFRWLDPSSPPNRVGYSRRWGLILNVPREELLAEGAA